MKNQGNMRKPEECLCRGGQRRRASWEEIFGDLKEEGAEKEPLAARRKQCWPRRTLHSYHVFLLLKIFHHKNIKYHMQKNV